MKKIVLLIIIIFCLTGCHAVTNIEIDENKVTEKVTVKASSDSEYSKIKNWNGFPLTLYYDQDLKNPFGSNRDKESGVEYYTENFDDNSKTLISTAEFSLNEHTRSSLIRGCFEFYNISNDEDNESIKTFATSEGLICDFSNFDVVVKTPYKVINNNATNVDSVNNIYTWKVNKSNKNSIYISLVIDFSKKYNEKESNNKNQSEEKTNNSVEREKKTSFSVYVIIAIVGLFIMVLLLSLIVRHKKLSKL